MPLSPSILMRYRIFSHSLKRSPSWFDFQTRPVSEFQPSTFCCFSNLTATSLSSVVPRPVRALPTLVLEWYGQGRPYLPDTDVLLKPPFLHIVGVPGWSKLLTEAPIMPKVLRPILNIICYIRKRKYFIFLIWQYPSNILFWNSRF